MGHAAHGFYMEAVLSKNLRQSQTDALFVVYEEHMRFIWADHGCGYCWHKRDIKDVQT